MEQAIKNILDLTDFQPSSSVNQVFFDLVGRVHRVFKIPDWCDEKMTEEIRRRCSLAESELEKYWSRRICEADDSKQELKNFPYLDNYSLLVRRELNFLMEIGTELNKNSSVVMIGSGSLPLTAWFLYLETGAKIDHIDSSSEAIRFCEDFSDALNWRECGHFLGDGAQIQMPFSRYDVVYLAGLAGENTEQKQKIINNILPSLKPNGRLVVRSAKGARSLLYPGFGADEIRNVKLLWEHHPQDEIINSVFIYKK